MRAIRVWPFAAALLALPLPAAHANPVLGFLAQLHAADEVPVVLSPAGGAFHGTLAVVQHQFGYRLHYFGLKAIASTCERTRKRLRRSPPSPKLVPLLGRGAEGAAHTQPT
jgi:hypothetical protein